MKLHRELRDVELSHWQGASKRRAVIVDGLGLEELEAKAYKLEADNDKLVKENAALTLAVANLFERLEGMTAYLQPTREAVSWLKGLLPALKDVSDSISSE